MRRIIAGMFITADGVVEAPEKWNPPYYDDELNQAVMPALAAAGTHLYGRRSYELFRAVFAGPAAPPHAELMTSIPKVVISTTLKDPDWGPTTVISRDITAALTELKQQPGKDITIGASGTLVRFLLTEGLVDELRLLVHPVVVGVGQHLFEGGGQHVPLTLLESRPHRNGVVALRYAPASLGSRSTVASTSSAVSGSGPAGMSACTRIPAEVRICRPTASYHPGQPGALAGGGGAGVARAAA